MRERLKAGSLVRPPEGTIQYKILEQVGSGSSSLVYRAEFRDDEGHCEILSPSPKNGHKTG